METTEISCHADLLIRIRDLKSDKFSQEEELTHTFNEFVYTLNPISIVKGSIHELAQDKEVQFDLARVGLNLGTNFLIDRIIGKHSNIKGFIRSELVGKLSTTLINKNGSKILSAIGNLIHRKSKQETDH